MGSIFMSPHYKAQPVSATDMKIASLAWGFTIGFSLLTCAKAGRQTIKSWKRARRPTVYVVLIWSEMVVSTIFGFICWFHLDGKIPPSFAFYFTILTLWALQVQFLLQIIINRIGLLIPNKRKVFYIKWGVAALITAINISVYNIWVPARLQASARYVAINEWWDRCEKAIYLVVDGMLNAYFLYLVKSRLLTPGMIKYKPVFNFNAVIVAASLSMDVLIISMMSLDNTFVYMQFHPVAYIVKLNIELTMAELISKVAKEPHKGEKYGQVSVGPWQNGGHGTARSWAGARSSTVPPNPALGSRNRGSYINISTQPSRNLTQKLDVESGNDYAGGYQAWVNTSGGNGSEGSSTIVDGRELVAYPEEMHLKTMNGVHQIGHDLANNENTIVKTMETTVRLESVHDMSTESDVSSSSSSTTILSK